MTPLGDDFPDIDTTIASAARMYDYALGGGSGLPTQQNVHQVAQSLDPAVRVAYIDNDPVVLGHQKVSALLAADKSTAFRMEDARDVDRIPGS